MQKIPLQSVPKQQVTTVLDGQYVQIDVEQHRTGLFANIYLDNELVIGGVVCQDRNRLVRSTYLGFAGDLAFVDSIGTADPDYTGLADRFALIYLSASEIGA